MPSKTPKILIIEDEEQVRKSYEDMFSFFGYQVESVPNGREGMTRINKSDYDIVVTDLNMPELNGIEVLKYVKKKKPYIEVIVITGYATLENAIEAMKVGAYDYFAKPIDIEHVRIVLRKCVQQIQARKENEELRSMTQQLKQLNELKDKFITITNHELRTPVTVLKGYIELIDYILESQQNKEISEAMEIVSETLQELVSIVEHMHDISSFDYGKKIVIENKIDIHLLLNTVHKEMKLLYEKRRVRLQSKIEGPPVIIKGDERQVKRTVRELLQNALKFTPAGGNVLLEYKVSEANGKIYIKVQDNGIGIPKDKLDLVFEPFYEVQNAINHMTSKTEFMGGGIGLGLTLAKEVIESHKGKLLLESEEKNGSTFTIVLPYNGFKESKRADLPH